MTNEDYEYIKSKCILPTAILGYTVKEDGVVKISKGSIVVSLRDDQDDKNIKTMSEIEYTPGFMFWNNSKEGEKFFNTNKETLIEFFVQAFLAS